MKKLTLILAAVVCSIAMATPVTDSLVMKVDPGSIVTDGTGAVTAWNDLGTLGNDLSSLSTYEPSVNAGAINGYDAVNFNKDRMTRSASVADDFIPGTGGLSIFMVMKIDSLPAGAGYYFRKGNYASSADDGWAIWADSTRLISRLNAENINDDAHKAGKTYFLSDAGQVGQWIIYSTVIGSTGDGTGVAPLDAYVNGTNTTTNGQVWNGGTYTGSISPVDSVFLGLDLVGDIAEVLVYNKPLSETEQNQVGYYLDQKYAIDTAYVPEPGSLLLMSLGGMFFVKRKQS